MCLSVAAFHDAGEEQFVCVGVAKGMTLHPRGAASTCLLTLRVVRGEGGGSSGGSSNSTGSGWSLVPMHRTPIEGNAIPSALCSFQGHLLVAAGRALTIYDLGRKRLHKKCELREAVPNFVTCLAVSLERVFAGDAAESVRVIRYSSTENRLSLLVDDVADRFVTAVCVLDYDSVAVGDRFGNVAVLRVPGGVEGGGGVGGAAADAAAAASSATAALWQAAGQPGSAPLRFTCVAQFYAGGGITSLSKGALAPGGAETLLYTSASGAIGSLAPLTSKEDLEFFTHLEMYLRGVEAVSIVGRDHLAFRSYFAPVSVRLFCVCVCCARVSFLISIVPASTLTG